MKNLITIIGFFGSTLFAKSQAVLNEFYFNPAAGEEEFVEIYNSSDITINLNCYTLIAYFDRDNVADNTDRGFYVLNFPDVSVMPQLFVAFGSDRPVDHQNGIFNNAFPPHFSWTDDLAGNSGYLKRFNLNAAGTAYQAAVDITAASADFNDILSTLPASPKYVVLLYDGALLINILVVNEPASVFPSFVANMPDLTIPGDGNTCGVQVLDFNQVADNEAEYITASIGNSNGARREFDGICGSWLKSSAGGQHTPGILNGAGSGDIGSLEITSSNTCGSESNQFCYDITGCTNCADGLDPFPVRVILYRDNGDNPGVLDMNDDSLDTKTDLTSSDPMKCFNVTANEVLLVFRTPANCFNEVIPLVGCVLPVSLKFFNAIRRGNEVNLSWETAFESK